MAVLSWLFFIFAAIGVLDRLLGNRWGFGKEMERGFALFAPVALSMIGMIILAPALAVWLQPLFTGFHTLFHLDPSILPASLFANDMGGAALSLEVTQDPVIGKFNAYVVSSMLGCIFSFTIPFATGIVPVERQKDLFLGFSCGIITVPVGCLISGLVCKIPIGDLLLNLLPVLLLALLCAVGLFLYPRIAVKILGGFSLFLKILIAVGLILGLWSALTKNALPSYFDTFDEAADVCVRVAITLAGAFPFLLLLGKLLKKPLRAFGKLLGINEISTLSILATLVTNATAFACFSEMDERGGVINAACATTSVYILGSHLAFTSAMAPEYVGPMILAKVTAGIASVLLALLVTSRKKKEN